MGGNGNVPFFGFWVDGVILYYFWPCSFRGSFEKMTDRSRTVGHFFKWLPKWARHQNLVTKLLNWRDCWPLWSPTVMMDMEEARVKFVLITTMLLVAVQYYNNCRERHLLLPDEVRNRTTTVLIMEKALQSCRWGFVPRYHRIFTRWIWEVAVVAFFSG